MRLKKDEISPKESMFVSMIKDVDVPSMTLNELVTLLTMNGYFSKYYIRGKLKKYGLSYKIKPVKINEKEKLFLAKLKKTDFSKMAMREIHAFFKNKISKNYLGYLLRKHQISHLKYTDIKESIKKDRENNLAEQRYQELSITINEIYKAGLVPTWSRIAKFENISRNKVSYKYKGIKLIVFK